VGILAETLTEKCLEGWARCPTAACAQLSRHFSVSISAKIPTFFFLAASGRDTIYKMQSKIQSRSL